MSQRSDMAPVDLLWLDPEVVGAEGGQPLQHRVDLALSGDEDVERLVMAALPLRSDPLSCQHRALSRHRPCPYQCSVPAPHPVIFALRQPTVVRDVEVQWAQCPEVETAQLPDLDLGCCRPLRVERHGLRPSRSGGIAGRLVGRHDGSQPVAAISSSSVAPCSRPSRPAISACLVPGRNMTPAGSRGGQPSASCDIDCYLRTVGEYQGLGRTKETKGKIIGTIDLSTGGDGWVADGSIKSVCDLKGKTIAVEPNLPTRLIMQMALKKDCGLSIKDTNLVDGRGPILGPLPTRAPAAGAARGATVSAAISGGVFALPEGAVADPAQQLGTVAQRSHMAPIDVLLVDREVVGAAGGQALRYRVDRVLPCGERPVMAALPRSVVPLSWLHRALSRHRPWPYQCSDS